MFFSSTASDKNRSYEAYQPTKESYDSDIKEELNTCTKYMSVKDLLLLNNMLSFSENERQTKCKSLEFMTLQFS